MFHIEYTSNGDMDKFMVFSLLDVVLNQKKIISEYVSVMSIVYWFGLKFFINSLSLKKMVYLNNKTIKR